MIEMFLRFAGSPLRPSLNHLKRSCCVSSPCFSVMLPYFTRSRQLVRIRVEPAFDVLVHLRFDAQARAFRKPGDLDSSDLDPESEAQMGVFRTL